MSTILFYIFAIFAGAFGAAFLRLCWEEPRKLLYILVGGTAICCGQTKNERVCRLLKRIKK